MGTHRGNGGARGTRRWIGGMAAVLLCGAGGLAIAPSAANAASPDDPPYVQLQIGDATVAEGSGGANTSAQLVVGLSTTYSAPLCVWYHTVNVSATGAAKATVHDGSADYQTKALKPAKIPAGKTSATISVPVLYDTVAEATESFSVVVDLLTDATGNTCGLTPDYGVTLARTTGTVTILDDDAPAATNVATIGDATLPEGSNRNRAAKLPVTFAAPLTSPVCVGYHTVDGTATGSAKATVHDGSADFQRRTSKVVKARAGKSTTIISVPILADQRAEPTESFSVVIDQVTTLNGATCSATPSDAVSVGDGVGSVTILNDDYSAPDAPTDVVASLADAPSCSTACGVVNLTWTAPFDGGTPIYEYQVLVSTDGGVNYDLVGVTSSTSYTGAPCGTPAVTCLYKVNANNVLPWSFGGIGPFSAPTAITTQAPPSAPTHLHAVHDPSCATDCGRLVVDWDAPSDGGSSITHYDVDVSTDGGLTVASTTQVTAPGTVVDCGSHGVSCQVFVRAVNILGAGATAASQVIDTRGDVKPSPPQSLLASLTEDPCSAHCGDAHVSWSPPAWDGDSPLDHYQVTITSSAAPTVTVDTTETSLDHHCGGAGTSCKYFVSAVNQNGHGSNAPNVNNQVTVPTLTPNAPTNVAATPVGGGQLSVTWNVPSPGHGPAITSYGVYVSTDGGTTYSLAASPTTNSVTTSCGPDGTTCQYVVTAVNAIGAGPQSAPSDARTITPDVPDAPTNVVASPAGNGQLAVTWDVPSPGLGSAITSYDVYVSTDGGTTYSLAASPTTNSLTTYCGPNGTTCQYVVTATNAAGASARSAPSEPRTIVSPPAAPTNVVASPAGEGLLTVTWDVPSVGTGPAVTSYEVYVSTDGGTTYTLAGSPTTNSLTTYCGPNGTTCQYVVTATNAIGASPQSAPSEPRTITPAVPNAPMNLAVTSSGGSTFLTWDAPTSGPEAFGYRVEIGFSPTAWAYLGTAFDTSFSIDDYRFSTWYFRVFAYNGDGFSTPVVIGPINVP